MTAADDLAKEYRSTTGVLLVEFSADNAVPGNNPLTSGFLASWYWEDHGSESVNVSQAWRWTQLRPLATINKISESMHAICLECPGGTKNQNTGRTNVSVCTECPGGTYGNSEIAASACISCVPTANSPAGSDNVTDCICNAGYTGPDGSDCPGCALSTYKPANGSQACTFCPDNLMHWSTEQSNINNCTCYMGFTRGLTPAAQWVQQIDGYSSQKSSMYAATQVIGSPDVYPNKALSPNAWAPANTTGGEAWLELSFQAPIVIAKIDIYEINATGACRAVKVKNETGPGWVTVWNSTQRILSAPREYRQAEYLPVAADMACFGCGCSGTSGSTSGTISGWPGNYNSSLDCWWFIKASPGSLVTLEFTSFITENTHDYVQILACESASGQFSDTESQSCTPPLAKLMGVSVDAPATYNSSTGFLKVKFHTDSLIVSDGFTATWKSFVLSHNESLLIGSRIFSPALQVYEHKTRFVRLEFETTGFTETYQVDAVRVFANATSFAAQWAHSVVNFSSLSQQTPPAAAQLLGSPDVFAAAVYADMANEGAWAPSSMNRGTDWLELRFVQPVLVAAVAVYETKAPGALSKIKLKDGTSWDTVWENTWMPATDVTCSGCSGCTQTADTFSGTISDGPGFYSANVSCWWRISAHSTSRLTLTFNEFFTESCCDFVSVYECKSAEDSCDSASQRLAFRLSGSSVPGTYTSSTGYLRVEFYSDGSSQYSGFSAYWSTSVATQVAGSSPRVFSPPISPRTYTTQDIRLEFDTLGFNVCGHAQVVPPLLGLARQDAALEKHAKLITLTPGQLTGLNEWALPSVDYADMTCSGCGCNSTAGSASGTISDGSGSAYYTDGLQCWWFIKASPGSLVTLEFTAFDTQDKHDYVQIFACESASGRFPITNSQSCTFIAKLMGTSLTGPATYSSSTGFLKVTFRTDGSVQRDGFNATWKSFGGGVLSRWGTTDETLVFSQENLVYRPTLGGSPGKSYVSFDKARTQFLKSAGSLTLNYQSAGGITVIARIRFPDATAMQVRNQ